MIKFAVEKWSDCVAEIRPIAHMLWEDVAVDKEIFRAKIDERIYKELEEKGVLHLVTARKEGKLVGIYLSFLVLNPHYEGQGFMAFTDAYYLSRDCRNGNTGLQLFSFAEKAWREKGCTKAYTSHKIHRDRSALMKELGWTPRDIIYTKVLK